MCWVRKGMVTWSGVPSRVGIWSTVRHCLDVLKPLLDDGFPDGIVTLCLMLTDGEGVSRFHEWIVGRSKRIIMGKLLVRPKNDKTQHILFQQIFYFVQRSKFPLHITQIMLVNFTVTNPVIYDLPLLNRYFVRITSWISKSCSGVSVRWCLIELV